MDGSIAHLFNFIHSPHYAPQDEQQAHYGPEEPPQPGQDADGNGDDSNSDSKQKRHRRPVARLALGSLMERLGFRCGWPPMRYSGIVVGSALLMIACVASIPLGPASDNPVRELLTLVTGALGLASLLASCLNIPISTSWRRWYRRLRIGVLALAFLLSAGTLITFAGAVQLIRSRPAPQTYFTDILAFSDMNAHLMVSGQNPYVTNTVIFRHALARYPRASATPLRGKVFGHGYTQPAPVYVYAVQARYVRSPGHMRGAFDPRTLHSYPALSFLLYVPLLLVGINNILLLHLTVYWLLFAWLVWMAPAGWRHWGALVALAAMPTLAASLLVSDEVIVIALILVAWHWRSERYLSSFLLGMACAYKQYAWFFLPFFALDILLTYGKREALWRGALTAASFLLPNLPFLIADPKSWLQSMLLPMSGSFFANGLGIVALSIGHLLPYAPPVFYAVLEVVALVAALLAMVRWRSHLGDGVLVLALLPLFFAFRSLPDYFAFVPWLAFYAVNRLYARSHHPVEVAHAHAHATRHVAPNKQHGLMQFWHFWHFWHFSRYASPHCEHAHGGYRQADDSSL